MTETWRHHLFGDPRAHFPGQAWTLCYEEQFYFVTGMLLLCARRRFFLGVAMVSLVTLAISEACRWNGVDVDDRGLQLRHAQVVLTRGSRTRLRRSMMKFAAITQIAKTSSRACVSG